ncbi:hypothetical protein G5714_024630 [Onychostoma macrolepis]|uniref:Uncharacterized protein n=1 Tax=Onychostoma macrolepis TaxID=369639 RepID=A0A7J6BH92_9TELE|nr:hypothetical protein G5714_024630 [Onychostoma macrolepis]
MVWLVKNLVRAVHQSDEKMDKNPKKQKKKKKKKKRVKLALCSSVDVMDSSSAALEDRDKPPSSSSSSSGKRRFKGLRRFFGRMLSFCGVSSSSEQDKRS